MRGIGFYDNPAARHWWEKFLVDYSPVGLRVEAEWPIKAKGEVIEQKGAGPGAIFLIRLDQKIPYTTYVNEAGVPEAKWDIVFSDLKNMGCVEEGGEHDFVTCIWSQWRFVRLLSFHRGLPASYTEDDPVHVASIKVTNGIVQRAYKFTNTENHETGVVDFFLFEPLPWYRAPYAIETDALKPEFISAFTDRMVVRSTYTAWYEKDPSTLPPGQMSDDGEEYVLHQPIPLALVKDVANRLIDRDDLKFRFWLGACLFYVLPIDAQYGSGTFRPMREDEAGRHAPYIVAPGEIEKTMKRQVDPAILSKWKYKGREVE